MENTEPTVEVKSWKVEVKADNTGKWASNGLRFKDEPSATTYGENLMIRWTLVSEWRVVPSEDEPNQ